jgi:hypothetical protein
MEIFCFTFSCGSPLANYYVAIAAKDELSARARMHCLFSSHWAGCYRLVEFQSQIAQYGYEPLAYVNYEASVRLGTNHEEIPLEIYSRSFTSGDVQGR